MADGVDTSQLDRFVLSLQSVPQKVDVETLKALRASARRMERSAKSIMQGQLSSPTSLPRYVASIKGKVEGVGTRAILRLYSDSAVSGLGGGIELGSRHHAPMPHLVPAYEKEQNNLAAGLDKALFDALSKL